ncbi:MAG: hypothetical protein QM733_11845 [Ilumatobacteraceae bacterium]
MAASGVRDEQIERFGATLGAVLSERANLSDVVSLAAELLADGVDDQLLLDLATTPSTASLEDVRAQLVQLVTGGVLPGLSTHPTVLEYFVDEDEIETLLTLVSIDAAAASLLAIYRAEQLDAPRRAVATARHSWAAELSMSSMWLADPARRRAWLTSLVEQATSEWELARIGAGPLEDFVSDDPDDLLWLQAQLRRSSGFRRVLAGAWIYGQVSPEAFERLEELVGQPLANPHRAGRDNVPGRHT